MKCTVLRPFPYSADGVSVRDLAHGAVEDIRDDLVPGLSREGFIAPEPSGGERPGGEAPRRRMVSLGLGRYDVYDANGAKLTAKPVRKGEADSLMAAAPNTPGA